MIRAFAFVCACLAAIPAIAARPARVESGLAFALTLTNGGRSISSDRILVRIPDTHGTLAVRIDGYDVTGGSFSAPIRLQNDTDADLFGLRVDLVSVTVSTGKTSGAAAAGEPQRAVADPLSWDQLPKAATSATQAFRASPVAPVPDAGQVIVLGVVTGVANVGRFSVAEAATAKSIDIDAGATGDLFVTDAAGKVFRMNAEGRGTRPVRGESPAARRKSGGPCESRRSAGRLCAQAPDGSLWTVEGEEFSVLDASGAVVRTFRPGVGPVLDLALGRTGRVYLLGRDGTITVLRVF